MISYATRFARIGHPEAQ